MRLERPCGCAAMKAPVGLSIRRAICDSRWKGFALTSVGAATNAKSKNFFLIYGQSETEAIPIVKPKNQRFSNAVSLSMRR